MIMNLNTRKLNVSKLEIRWYDKILLNRPIKVILISLVVAVVAPVLIYRFLFFTSIDLPPADGFSFGSCLVARTLRLPCGYANVNSEQCHPHCCYDFRSKTCFHRFPSRFSYVMDRVWDEDVVLSARVATIPFSFQNSLPRIKLSIDEVSKSHLSLNFYNPALVEIPHGNRLEEKNYFYDVASPELNVVVNSTERMIFNTNRGPLVASQNIWELTFWLTNESMYGLGEIPLEKTTKVLYNHNGGISGIPLIFAKSGHSYHGILIEAVAPTVITIRKENQIVLRSITSLGVKLHLFVGPKPADIMRDVRNLLGVNKRMEYWMFGAHICSETTPNTALTVTQLNNFINTLGRQNVPFDSHCGVSPIIWDNDCTRAKITLVNNGARAVRNARKRFIPHMKPYIMYHEEMEQEEEEEPDIVLPRTATRPPACFDVRPFRSMMLQSNSGGFYKGLVKDEKVIYPDYKNISLEFIQKMWVYNLPIDGMLLEDTWPLDESDKKVDNMQNYLPYFNKYLEAAFNHTPKWNATRTDGKIYMHNHNEYGNYYVDSLKEVLGEVPTFTSSQFLSGKIIINRQNVSTTWSGLHREITEAALGGASGNWLWSSPICGDTEHLEINTHNNLCVKWYMAATYMPMIKIHSRDGGRDPLSFEGTHRTLMINAMRTRISLAPYFYTVLQNGPLLRPMFFQYPEIDQLKDTSTQFSVGNDLLIVPNLQPSQSHVHVWLPSESWYELWSGLKIEGNVGDAVTMTTTESDFLTMVRAGSIIVLQKDVTLTAVDTRLRSQYSLTIALKCSNETLIDETEEEDEEEGEDEEEEGEDKVDEGEETVRKQHRMKQKEVIEEEADENEEEKNTETDIKCHAKGELFMSESMTMIFKADDKSLTIQAEGEDFDILCKPSGALWANVIREIILYGLNADLNNFDNFKQIRTSINLCQLQTETQIVFYYDD
ncbi:uncharacterized protein LOC101744138 isoform X2 [Bombyx mori]|uniref:Alpha-glucosidase n=1 Tax=Bombyx mori TaxID=7091 RepID=A0A8R2M5E6_BOMMO|nr:probable alpha-glucosidase Os06g0675700 isoform X2 [Bombyx mori]